MLRNSAIEAGPQPSALEQKQNKFRNEVPLLTASHSSLIAV